MCPAEAYLPSAIDRERDSFAAAAGKTPGIAWLDVEYARLLKHAGGRQELGARSFLRQLGAATAPRLALPPGEGLVPKRETRPGFPALRPGAPEPQAVEVRRLGQSWERHLLEDRYAPDLVAVARDIAADRNAKRRRRRGLALLGVLVRNWERRYADFVQAKAAYSYYSSWTDPHPVIASWLADLVAIAWLPSASGRSRPPSELALPTEISLLAYKGDRGRFIARVDERLLRSPALAALRLRRGPSARELIDQLRELRRATWAPELEDHVRSLYQLLALHCTGDTRRVDDMGMREFREAFAGQGPAAGLLLIQRRWYRSAEVFTGEPLFPRQRPFVPQGAAYQPLWTALQLRRPPATECLAVLRELAQQPLAAEDRGTVLQTLRYLATQIESMTAPLRASLRRLPLWNGDRWNARRPMYAVEDPDFVRQVQGQIAVWASGFSSYAGLERLCDALGVERIGPEDFRLDGVRPSGIAAGPELRRQHTLAVQHLQDALAASDQRLHDALSARVSWAALAAAPIVIDDTLKLSAQLSSGATVHVDAGAAMHLDPLVMVVRDPRELGSAEGAGRAIASLFHGDRQKIAWAWSSMWVKAGAGVEPEKIILSTAGRDEGPTGATGRLTQLKGQAEARGGRQARSKSGSAQAGQAPEGGVGVTVKPLKELTAYTPDAGAVVNPGQARPGVILPTRDAEKERQERDRVRGGAAAGSGASPRPRVERSVLPPADEREALALAAVQKALQLGPQEIVDLRSRHGLGADAVDELRQFYEIKMQTSGGVPNEVTLQPSQLDAAQEEDFFLAVVSGLAEGESELRVRFIFEPLRKLRTRIRGEATLVGVGEVEALEYRFRKQE